MHDCQKTEDIQAWCSTCSKGSNKQGTVLIEKEQEGKRQQLQQRTGLFSL